MGRRRAFGSVRQLQSGKWQVRYRGPDGLQRTAPATYLRKRDAEVFLAKAQADLARDDWFDPMSGRVTVAEYGRVWIAERPLAATTRERYEVAFRVQIVPSFGETPLNRVRDALVRSWRTRLLEEGTGQASVAKAYRLFHAIMSTAVDDGLVRRNPCRIKGAGDDKSEERPVLTVVEVLRLADEISDRFRALVLLATFTGLRFGELAALRRGDVDLEAGYVRVSRSQVELSDGRLVVKEPKSAAGRRRVAIPSALREELTSHVERYAGSGPEGLIFVGPKGGRLRRQNFRDIWVETLASAGVRQVHFHDLRHTGNTLAAEGGASLRELMERLGHSSPRAAMIYQHLAMDRDRHIADGLSSRIERARQSVDAPVPRGGALA